jgi:hypothetical protein
LTFFKVNNCFSNLYFIAGTLISFLKISLRVLKTYQHSYDAKVVTLTRL